MRDNRFCVFICISASDAASLNEGVYAYTTGQIDGVIWEAVPETLNANQTFWTLTLWNPTVRGSSFVVVEI